jgi:excisionase family DNA binding protein
VLQGPGTGRPPLRLLEGGRDRLLTVKEVAEQLGVCTATAYALAERGELAHVRIRNAIRVLPADLAKSTAHCW